MKEKLQQLVTLVEEIPVLKDSVIGELFQVMLSGEEPVIEEAVEPDEKVIGEMNDLEKSLMILCSRYSATEKKLVDQFRSILKNDEEMDTNEIEKMEAKLEKTRGRFKVVRKFLWKSIQENNPNPDKTNTRGLVARSGFKIATLPKKESSADELMSILEDEGASIDSLAGLVMGGPTGAGIPIPGIRIRIR